MIDRRILPIHIVTCGGFGHRVEHAGARLGNGVAAKIDNAHESGLGKQGKSLSGGITAGIPMNIQPLDKDNAR
jgi:hypothetical protein